MVFQDANVAVAAGDGMLGPHDELVGVAWVLVVVYKIGYESREDVEGVELELQVADTHEELHGL